MIRFNSIGSWSRRTFATSIFFAATQREDVLGVRLNARLGDVIDHREQEHVLKKALHEGFQLRAGAPMNPGLTARGSRIAGGETIGFFGGFSTAPWGGWWA